MRTDAQNRILDGAAAACLLAAFGVSLCVGRYPLGLSDILGALTGAEGMAAQVFWRLRLPRSLAVLVSGGALGVAGAVLGHSYPIFFGFKGGKGIATSFGALLFVFPWQALTAFCVFLLIVFFTHYVSAGSIAAAVTFPLLVVLSTPYDPLIWGLSILIGGFVIYRHRGNIVRLVQHRESRLDFSSLTGKKK